MKNYLKKSLVYTLIRKYKSKILDCEFKSLLNELFSAHNDIIINKVKLGSIPVKPVVLGVGHLDWEKYGFWKTFEEKFDFDFLELKSSTNNISQDVQNTIASDILKATQLLLEKHGNVDFVFFYCDASYLNKQVLLALKKQGISTVMMGLDDKHRYKKHQVNNVFGGQELIIPYLSFYWTTWKSLALHLNKQGYKAIYLAEGANQNYHKREHVSNKDIDVLFLGNAYGVRKETVDFLIANGVNIQAYGSGWDNGFVTFEETIELYNRSKIVLGVGGVGHSSQFKHLKGRDFEATMCGCCYLTTYNPELADWFDIGKEILCYSSDLELLEQIKYYLKSEKEREKIAENAYLKSISEHTWNDRLDALLNKIYETT